MNEPKLSVLMSVYNETCDDIKESIDSVLAQTYSNFEFIIIDDNPRKEDYKELLKMYEKKDSRILIVENDTNIGLAMSMNKAAELASGSIFVRMDADDVCLPNRFEIQLALLIENNYDLVCGRYTVIDENSVEVAPNDIKPEYITSDRISATLPYYSSIHHPTVMMTKSIFKRVSGYRNFPCAQDYDLWLRMLEANTRFGITQECILKYRKRMSGISASKRIKQRITVEYIRDLYIERLEKGKDSFSQEHYERYIDKYIKDEKRESKLIECGNLTLFKARRYSNEGKKVVSKVLKLKVWLFNPVYRHIFTKLWYSKNKILRLQKRKKNTR